MSIISVKDYELEFKLRNLGEIEQIQAELLKDWKTIIEVNYLFIIFRQGSRHHNSNKMIQKQK